MADLIERADAINAIRYVTDSPNYSKSLGELLHIPSVKQTEQMHRSTAVFITGTQIGEAKPMPNSITTWASTNAPQTERGYMWTCPKCGTENHSDFKKCPCCGYTPQTDCDTCRYNSDEWDSPKCDGCSKAHSNYEPQTDCAWK